LNSFVIALVLGVVFYYIYNSYLNFQKKNSSNFQADSEEFDEEKRLEEYRLIISLVAKVAKADGVVSPLEAELISNALDDMSNDFKNPKIIRDELREIFYKEKGNTSNIKEISRKLYYLLENEPQKRLNIVAFLLNLPFVDMNLSQEEEEVITTIALALQVDANTLQSLIDSFKNHYKENKEQYNNIKNSPGNDSYAVLGLSPNASFEEVKKRYRELVKEYHPDIIRGKGLGEDMVQKATKKLQEINAAYEAIRAHKS